MKSNQDRHTHPSVSVSPRTFPCPKRILTTMFPAHIVSSPQNQNAPLGSDILSSGARSKQGDEGGLSPFLGPAGNPAAASFLTPQPGFLPMGGEFRSPGSDSVVPTKSPPIVPIMVCCVVLPFLLVHRAVVGFVRDICCQGFPTSPEVGSPARVLAD